MSRHRCVPWGPRWWMTAKRGMVGVGRILHRMGTCMWQIIMTSSRVNPPNGGLGDSVNPLNKMPRKNSNVEELFSEIGLPGSVFFTPQGMGWFYHRWCMEIRGSDGLSEVGLCFQHWGGWCVVVSWMFFMVETGCVSLYILMNDFFVQLLPSDPLWNL